MVPFAVMDRRAAPSPAVCPTKRAARRRARGESRAVGTATASERPVAPMFRATRYEHSALFWVACVAGSLAMHAAVFMLHLPGPGQSMPDVSTTRDVIVVRRYIPPPPKNAPGSPLGGAVVPRPATRRLPVPDPTPAEPEPLISARLEAPEMPLPFGDEVVVLLGDPEPPPAPDVGPLVPGMAGVTEPELIERVEPDYPEVARRARVQGRVILQAVIHKDGTVGQVTVLHDPAPHLGLSDEAVSAVRQWRYRPGMQQGRPVDVYFTVVVDFTLL